jgi:hypothetical protein
VIGAWPNQQTFEVWDSLSWSVHKEPYITVLSLISQWYDAAIGRPHIPWAVYNQPCPQQSDGLACGWAATWNMIQMLRGDPIVDDGKKYPVQWFCKQIEAYLQTYCVVFTIY